METKANPNPKGCLAAALPDEPMFILLARDADAPATIKFWAERRARRQVTEPSPELMGDSIKIAGAIDDMEAFERWRRENEGRWRTEKPRPMFMAMRDCDLEDVLIDAICNSDGIHTSPRDLARAIVMHMRKEVQ